MPLTYIPKMPKTRKEMLHLHEQGIFLAPDKPTKNMLFRHMAAISKLPEAAFLEPFEEFYALTENELFTKLEMRTYLYEVEYRNKVIDDKTFQQGKGEIYKFMSWLAGGALKQNVPMPCLVNLMEGKIYAGKPLN